MKKTTILLLALFAILLLNSCTANTHNIAQCVTTEPKGFWYGLWHGIISPITFIISLFSDSVGIYEANNNGGWYNFGFILGCGMIFGGGSSASSKK